MRTSMTSGGDNQQRTKSRERDPLGQRTTTTENNKEGKSGQREAERLHKHKNKQQLYCPIRSSEPHTTNMPKKSGGKKATTATGTSPSTACDEAPLSHRPLPQQQLLLPP